MTSIVPILGGLASGFVGGILTVEVRARREERLREKQWYARLIRLSQRVERAHSSKYDSDTALYARNTCSGILGNLTKHIMTAPDCVSNTMLDLAEELAIECQIIQQIGRREVSGDPSRISDCMDSAVDKAKKVIKQADQEKDLISSF